MARFFILAINLSAVVFWQISHRTLFLIHLSFSILFTPSQKYIILNANSNLA
ncbi:hypothetical protein ACLSZ7_03035 [Avibacterium gallinarum]|uniref:hypothetical protein n=1 Tax=Avibacterium gallinarum TaxID=755 RepID=UPI003BF909FB